MIWQDEAAEIHTAAQQTGGEPAEPVMGANGNRDAETSRLPTLTDVLRASGEATSRGSWNTAVMAEGVGFEPT